MRKHKCTYFERECKVEGCTSKDFYETCYNMCKKHKNKADSVYRKKVCNLRNHKIYKSLLPQEVSLPTPIVKKKLKIIT